MDKVDREANYQELLAGLSKALEMYFLKEWNRKVKISFPSMNMDLGNVGKLEATLYVRELENDQDLPR